MDKTNNTVLPPYYPSCPPPDYFQIEHQNVRATYNNFANSNAPPIQVVVEQPNTLVQPRVMIDHPHPKTYACLAWLSCLFCFCPTGLVSIYYSNKAKSALQEGDLQKAILASLFAKRYAYISITVGLNLTWVLYLISRSIKYYTYY